MTSGEGMPEEAPGRAGEVEGGSDPEERALVGKVRGLLGELRPVLEELADDTGE